MGSFIDLSGQKFGRLLVLERSEQLHSRTAFLCKCDCGQFSVVTSNALRRRATKSCGCWLIDGPKEFNSTHGLTRTPEHGIWRAMKQRCSNPKHRSYQDYGGRGISVCKAWAESFETFLADMGQRPSSKHTIERNDTNKNYEPGNCRWATVLEQANNKRTNRMAHWGGHYLSIREICRRSATSIAPEQVIWRLDQGWSLDDALLAPHYARRPRAYERDAANKYRQREDA